MSVNDAVLLVAVALAGVTLGWWLLRPRGAAVVAGGGRFQEVRVRVRGGYSPSRIHARPGLPVRLIFDRQEAGDCTSRVVFPSLGITASLPPFTETVVTLPAPRRGRYAFACGMDMSHGLLVVGGRRRHASRVLAPGRT